MENNLFPAHAGVIPFDDDFLLRSQTVPRTRGGDPLREFGELKEFGCSPHTRG